MVESCPKDSPGQKSLLEAAKAFGEAFDLPRLGSRQACDLRAAIAREEARPSAFDAQQELSLLAEVLGCKSGQGVAERGADVLARAQQAEADAAWHKAESARLSAELAKERGATARPSAFHVYLAEVRAELQASDAYATVDAARFMRQRAEKAEANEKQLRQECADLAKQVAAERAEACRSVKAEADAKHFGDQITSLRQELTDVHGALAACLRPETQTGSARGDANVIAMVLQETVAQLLRAGYSAPLTVRQTLPLVVDELLRLRAEAESAKGRMASAIAADLDTMRERAERAEAEAGTLRNQLNLAVERSERLSEQLKGSEHRNQNLLRAVDEQRLAQQATNDLHRMLEDAGVPGVNANMTQMSLGERIGWLIGEWKHAVRRLAPAPKRDPEPCVRPPCTNPADLLELAWGLLANVSGGDWHQQTPTWHGAVIAWRDDWHRYLDARRKGALVDATPASWYQAEIERLRKANRELQEQNWDLRTPDFPMLAEPPLHLHYAYMPGDWSSKSDEWFTYSRLMRNGHPTKMVRVGWRHGPGVSNRSATLSGAGSAIDSAIAKVLAKYVGDPPHPLVRDHATGAMGVKVGIVRDPVTGWTFDTMRQQFDAARTTVRVLAAELVAARQQIAGTKGFEA